VSKPPKVALYETTDVQQQIIKLGIVPVVSEPPEMLQAYINSEMMRWRSVVRQVGLAGSEG
jgi:hypothetical protein